MERVRAKVIVSFISDRRLEGPGASRDLQVPAEAEGGHDESCLAGGR
jgi:hypothetical protein